MSKEIKFQNNKLIKEADNFIPKTDIDLALYFERNARRYNRLFMEEKEAGGK